MAGRAGTHQASCCVRGQWRQQACERQQRRASGGGRAPLLAGAHAATHGSFSSTHQVLLAAPAHPVRAGGGAGKRSSARWVCSLLLMMAGAGARESTLGLPSSEREAQGGAGGAALEL